MPQTVTYGGSQTFAIAAEAGDARAANTVLLGILSLALPVGVDEWLAVIEKLVKAKAVEANRNAFLVGRELSENL